MRALVIGQSFNASVLAAVRGLGRGGWYTGVGTASPKSLAYASRYGSREHLIPRPELDLDGCVRATNEAIAEGGYEVVFAAGDAEVLALAHSRDEIRAHVPYGPLAMVTKAMDKLTLAQAASAVGLRTPHTVEATEAAIESMGQDVVVKSRLHWHPAAGSTSPRLEATTPSNADDRLMRVKEIMAAGGSAVLQERVIGPLMSFTTLFDPERGAIATCQHISTHVWPPGNGMPTRSVSIPIDRQLAGKVSLLLRELQWSGLVNLQFIAPAVGDPCLIDFNGRFYYTMALAADAGVNFPDLAGRLATGRDLGSPIDGEIGRRYYWREGDVRRAMVERRGGLIADLASGVGYAVGAIGPLGAADDRRPTGRYVMNRVQTIAQRLVHKSSVRGRLAPKPVA